MSKKYWIAGTYFDIPISNKEIAEYINETYTKEEKLKLLEGMSEKRMVETIEMLNNLKTNGEIISVIKRLSKKIKGNLTLTERTAVLNSLSNIINTIPVKEYNKN